MGIQRTLGVALVLLGLPACLVTDPIDFDEDPGSPPMLLNPATGDGFLDRIVWLSNDPPTSWSFSLRVRDAEVTKHLQARFRVVREGMSQPEFEPTIELPPSGALIRNLDIVLESTKLNNEGCHRIDVAVSGSFRQDADDPGDFDEVNVEDDIDIASWWIWEGVKATASKDERDRIFESCETIDTLFPATVAGSP